MAVKSRAKQRWRMVLGLFRRGFLEASERQTSGTRDYSRPAAHPNRPRCWPPECGLQSSLLNEITHDEARAGDRRHAELGGGPMKPGAISTFLILSSFAVGGFAGCAGTPGEKPAADYAA